jgi:dipeptidyl aminopeptidase/acylaminoacyl peptidase
LAVKVQPGERNKVYLIQTSPPVWGPAKLQERIYDRPGDRVDTFDIVSLDLTGAAAPTLVDTVEYGDLPWFRATPDGAFTYTKMDRGYGRFCIMRIDPATATARAVFDDDPATFVDSTALIQEYVDGSNEIIVSSERDGWHHLYLADGKGSLSQITNGPWVVRGVERVDSKARQIVFRASGMNPGEDPYNVHFYRIGFDGSGLVSLTPAPGNHRVSFSPDQTVLVDTYSTVQNPPVFELRNAETGGLIATVDRGDISQLVKGGWRAPEPFRAKGRDGVTDIYGVVYWPTNFDRRKQYPIVEDIYAGPQDSFVPKSFAPNRYQARLAELGFIVVQIDGMGTRNRSKAFHDVCYQNLADAGLPDRILWMKALARKYPAIDLSRVGVFGTSAGGQNAGAAVLFHPEFYKVAVASCGCHDNRLDKIWWNEQWMGVMGAHYKASSNIENAGKLQGDLLLMVGELDTNVPTESTFRFAAALQAAGKEYELVVIPNSDHTAGGPYGERKRRDFLVRHLLGVEPPNPNRKGPTP